MLAAIAALLVCQLIGEAAVRAVDLPFPGPVVGMILLFVLMLARAPLPVTLGNTADGLLQHLSLLFVPAGVGVVQHLELLSGAGLRLMAVVVLTTLITLAVTALVFAALARLLHADALAAGKTRERRATMTNFVDLWVYLSGSPLLWLTTTLLAYLAADAISAACGRHPLANPVLIAVTFVSIVVVASGTSFPAYFAGAQFVHFLLGPATVALAVPLVRHLPQVRRALVPMLVALVAGSATAIACAVWLARAFGLDRAEILALAPKSATAAIAMGIAEKMGGDPALTAVLTILTGITGAIIVTPLMNALRLRNYAARGFAAGLTSHGIGTARAFQVDPLAGTFAGIALGLNGLLTALLVPLLLPWLLN